MTFMINNGMSRQELYGELLVELSGEPQVFTEEQAQRLARALSTVMVDNNVVLETHERERLRLIQRRGVN